VASPLVDDWLEGIESEPVRDEASIAAAQTLVRAAGTRAGLDGTRIAALATIASELARNALLHGRGGMVAARIIHRGGIAGVEVVCADAGLGIRDPVPAFREEPRPSGSLGSGLAGVSRLADEADFDVRIGEGTCVRARKFARAVPSSEVGIFGRPLEGLDSSGDDAAFVRHGDALMLAIADGLGHGDPAREASRRAMHVFRQSIGQPLDGILRSCGGALEGTRGAAMCVVRVEPGRVIHAGIGNVECRVYGPHQATVRLSGVPGIVGGRRGAARIRIEETPLVPPTLVVAFTDGLTSGVNLAEIRDALTSPALLTARRLLERFGRPHDDALVAVVR
jgi:anti-sigma regulatory factor (Ser/Thr protein kinase)